MHVINYKQEVTWYSHNTLFTLMNFNGFIFYQKGFYMLSKHHKTLYGYRSKIYSVSFCPLLVSFLHLCFLSRILPSNLSRSSHFSYFSQFSLTTFILLVFLYSNHLQILSCVSFYKFKEARNLRTTTLGISRCLFNFKVTYSIFLCNSSNSSRAPYCISAAYNFICLFFSWYI